MKTKGLALIMCLLISVGVSAQKIKGNGNIVTKEVQVSAYDAIDIRGNISYENNGFNIKKRDNPKFYYTQKAGGASLAITIDENLFPLLDISSTGGKLIIKPTDKKALIPTSFSIKGSSANLSNISISGAMTFVLESALKADDLTISLSGAGDILLERKVELGLLKASISGAGDVLADDLACNRFEGSISGAGDVKLKGKAEQARFSVSGAGDIDAYDFTVKEASASVSGVGDVKIHVTDKLDASTSGVGDISYKGNPSINSKKSGMGSIRQKN